jgi:hypothetical protein
MNRHYGLKVGERVVYNKKEYKVKTFSSLDNNKCYLESIDKTELVVAVCEWCKKV